jgi:hypothetical protein
LDLIQLKVTGQNRGHPNKLATDFSWLKCR